MGFGFVNGRREIMDDRHGQDILDELKTSGADEGSILEIILFENAEYKSSNSPPPHAKGYIPCSRMRDDAGLALVGYLVEINRRGQIEMAAGWENNKPNYDMGGWYFDARCVRSFKSF